MLEEDRHALRELKAHFEELAGRIDGGATIPSIDLSYYHVVYRAATRNAKPSEYPGYDVGELLYMDYQEMLTSYLLRHADVNASSDVEVFKKVLDIWSRYTQLFKWNARTFSYLSRYYIVNHSKPSLRQVACSIFLEQVFKKTSGSMTQVALQFLVQERDGVPVDRVLIKGALDLFASMGIEGMESEYSKEFLWSFLEYMKKECIRMAESWKSCTAQQFLTRMQRALQEEMERCDHYFSSADKKSILSCMEEGLGDALPTVEKLLNSEDGFRRFLAQRDKDHLEAYYSMFCKRETWLQNLGVILKSHIESEATELGRKYEGDENAKDALNYVCAMFSLFESISAIVTQCFHGEFVMAKAAREGFDRAFAGGLPVRCEKTGKSRQIPFGECLAHYMDWLLKQNHESQQTVEAEMNRVVGILGIQSDRDCFIRTAGDLMAERIVFPEYTYDEEKEKLFIQKLKQRCGPSSTTHLESMQNDLTVSNAFRATETLTSLGKAPSFQVTWLVGRKGMWPSWMTCDRAGLILPREVQQVLDDLSDAYLPQPSRRILMWSHECSNAELLGNFESNQAQTMCVTGVQAAVLLHFNAAAEYSIGELAARCGISSEDVMKALEPILQSTVLVARHGSPSATDSSRVKFNSHFCCRKKKLRLLPSRSRISVVGPSSSGTSSTSDVRPAVCAWIAKILKSRGKLSHSELMAECAAQLSRLYVVSSAMFKQAVEELVRKQIIERDRQQAGMYTYVP